MCSTTWKTWKYILWSKNHVLKKVGRGSCRAGHNLFSIYYFLNVIALGYPKSVTIIFLRALLALWVNKSLRMMCTIIASSPVLLLTKSKLPTHAQATVPNTYWLITNYPFKSWLLHPSFPAIKFKFSYTVMQLYIIYGQNPNVLSINL
jgi:hypothetical protein